MTIEDVAKIIMYFLPEAPCNYDEMDECTYGDMWCEIHCGEHTPEQCWIHAIENKWYEELS